METRAILDFPNSILLAVPELSSALDNLSGIRNKNMSIIECYNDHDVFSFLQNSFKSVTAIILSANLPLAELEFIDSAGMGMLLVAQDQAQNGNWKLSVQKPQGQVKKMLELAKLSQVISID